MSVIQIERFGAVALLTMNRPEARNALDLAMREAFAAAIAEVRDDPAVRAIVLTGAGGHFCAGGDVKAISGGGQGERDIYEGRERIRKIHRWFDELVDLEKPVIAAVDGVAFGAGLSLALAADFILASPRAKFCAVFARLGYVPDMGAMYSLPRAVGLARAKELVFSGRMIDAQEALGMGLVQAIHPRERLLQEALALAARFEHAPAGALAIAKQMLNRSFESDRRTVFEYEAMAQSLCRESAFHQEAVARFLGKQPPLFDWERSTSASVSPKQE